jgi:predicted alpha/beta superfamily hydrolase
LSPESKTTINSTEEIKSAGIEVRRLSQANLRLHKNFHSRILGNQRHIMVYVPPNYDEKRNHQYATLYLHDGQNLFDDSTAFAGKEWQVDEAAQQLIEAGEIEPLIIIGIYNNGAERINEYTPTRDPKLGGGKADLYGRMIVEELLPFIAENYRVLTEPEHTGMGGSSLGGLVSLYLGMRYPHIFGKLAVLSPSVWWNQRAILRMISVMTRKPPLKIWLDMGTSEGGMSLEDTELLRDVLEAKGWVEGKDLQYSEIEGAVHDESAWAERVRPFLRYLFPKNEEL